MKYWLFLTLAIAAEVCATSALKACDGFSRPLPSLVVVAGYSLAFFLLSISLRAIPVGIAYAVWSGLGTVLIALVGVVVFGQRPDAPAVIGMLFIIGGVVILNVFSKMTPH